MVIIGGQEAGIAAVGMLHRCFHLAPSKQERASVVEWPVVYNQFVRSLALYAAQAGRYGG